MALTAVWCAAGCSGHTAPAGFLPTTAEAQRRAQGGWLEMTWEGERGVESIDGELLAITEDTVWVMQSYGGVAIPTDRVREGQLTGYDSNHGEVSSATALGVLSTASNGAFLILTAPMWAIGGSLAAGSQSRVAMDEVPPARWADLAAYARFPQGMPPGVALSDLRPIAR